MKERTKIVLAVLSACLMLAATLALTACNVQVLDTTYEFDKAYVAIPGKDAVSGKVESWRDYDDSDMVQVVINGTTYYTHGSNVVLVQSK